MRIALFTLLATGLLCTRLAWAQGEVPQEEVEKLKQAIAADPKDVNAHFDLAVAYSVNGQDALAIPEYQKVLELQPDLYEVHLNYGQVLLRAKRPEQAAAQLRRAHEQKPTEFRPAYFLGEALFDLKQYSEAVTVFEAAAKIDPNDAASVLGRGRSMAHLGQWKEAEPYYRQAIALGADRTFLLELAQVAEAANQLDAAAALYAEFPDNPAAVERVGVLRLRQGQDKEAITALESVVKTSPTEANRMALVSAYVRVGSLAQAEPLMAKLTDSAPTNYDWRMLYGRILRDERKSTEAAREFEMAAKLKPDAAEAWSELAGMEILAERYQQALAALDQVKKLGAEKEGHVFFRATTLDRLHLKKEAIEYYQRFLEMSHSNPDQEFQARQRVRMLERELGKR